MADERMGPRWRVVSIEQTTALAPGNRFQDVYEATVETAFGVVFKVQVPVSAYSAEVLASAIEPEVQALEAGRFLSG